MNRENRKTTVILSVLFLVLNFGSNLFAKVPQIAVVLPLTGVYSETGEQIRNGIIVAQDLMSMDENFELVFIDNFSDIDSTEAVTNRITANESYIAIAGGYPSITAQKISEIVMNSDIPYIIIASSEDSLTKVYNKNVFRIVPPTTKYNEGLLSWIVKVVSNKNTIGIITETSQNLSNASNDIIKELTNKWGGKSVEYRFDVGSDDLNELVLQLKRDSIRFVYLLTSDRFLSNFLNVCNENEWMPFGMAIGLPSMLKELEVIQDNNFEYLFAPALWDVNLPYPFLPLFEKRYVTYSKTHPTYHSALGAAFYQVIHQSMLGANNRELLRTNLFNVNVSTYFGNVKFENIEGYYNQNRVKTIAMQMQNGRWRIIWPHEVSDVQFVYPVPKWNDRDSSEENTLKLLFPFFLFFAVAIMLLMTYIRRKELIRKIDDQ